MANNTLSDVTILVSAFNAESFIQRFYNCISSINQSVNVLIVDDYSTDNTYVLLSDIFKEKSNVRIVHNKFCKGFANALNFGISIITTKYILRFDVDDFMPKNRVEILLNELVQKGLDFCGSGYRTIDINGVVNAKRTFPSDHKTIANRFLAGYFGMGGALIIGKAEAFRYLRFDEAMVPGEEFDFFVRAIANGFKLGNVNILLYDYYFNSLSLSNSNLAILNKVEKYQLALQKQEIPLGRIRFWILKKYYYNKDNKKFHLIIVTLFVLFKYIPRFKLKGIKKTTFSHFDGV